MKPSQAKALGVTGDITRDPERRRAARPVRRAGGIVRRACYESLDKTLTTKIIPWVPYLRVYNPHITSSRVTQWDYDQFSGTTAYAHVAVS